MADVPIDCEFPIWGLLPKKETGVVSFLSKYPEYDGRNTVIAIFDSGVDPAAEGLKVTSTGETKVIERFDCSGCGDVDTSKVLTSLEEGNRLTGLTGRKLVVPSTWTNPSGKWRIGVLHPFNLYPSKLKERMQAHRKEHIWDRGYKPVLAKATYELQLFESEHASATTLTAEEKQQKEELEARVEVLTNAEKKFNDLGPTYDCVLFHDGTVWRACIDTLENGEGDLASGLLLAEYSVTHEHAHLTAIDEMTVSINVHNDGAVLEVVGMCSTHGTHVAAIAAGCFPGEPAKNGVAPGAKIVSLTIGDSRLGSMETGTAIVRACIKVMELSKKYNVDVINMSYGEHAHWSNSGRLGSIMNSVVREHGVSWVVSAGNHGPALCTLGAPPDISHASLIGVAAYVSPEMMIAAYSMRAATSGTAFSWSSRGPAPDGGAAPSVAAPGAATAPVARFTLRNTQLMNGTSMAAPHVAGAIGALISGLKAKGIKHSPFSIKRALENSANFLNHVEPWAQGCGLLNVERAFEILSSYTDQAERDVVFNLQCGPSNSRGILIRPRAGDYVRDVNVTVEPHFLEPTTDVDKTEVIKRQISYKQRFALTSSAPWVETPSYLDMMNVGRSIALRITTGALPPGPHFASVNAYDVSCVEKGPVFRIPVTVFQPEEIPAMAGAPSLSYSKVLFKPATIQRHFVTVPAEATWGLLKLTTLEKEKTGRFLVHVMQILPKQSCRTHETQKLINVTAEAPTFLPFRLVGGEIVEIVLAKYWANLGDLTIDYNIEFRGVKPDCGRKLTIHGAAGLTRLTVSTLRTEELQPSFQLKYLESFIRPSESKLAPLTSRDIIPPARQIYQIINTYNFSIPKATEITPQINLLCDMLYESEFESQLWMLFNSCKQLIAVGDAYPAKYNVKVEKGEFTLRLAVRHESRALLERLADTPLQLQNKLAQPINLDVYTHPAHALTNGKKFSSGSITSGSIFPMYIASVPNDKISRTNISIGQTLTGQATFPRDEFGRKVDTYDVQYIVCEPPKKNNTNNKEKGKSYDDYMDALKEMKTGWLGKLEGDKLEQIYEEIQKAFPDHMGAHIAYLHALDSPTDPTKLPHAEQVPDVTTAWCEQLSSIADKVIKAIDKDKLLAYLGMKNDNRPDASKIKQEQEKQKGYLIDALCRKGVALCRLSALSNAESVRTSNLANMNDLLALTDITDSKAIHYGVWYCFTQKHWGRAVKLLMKIQEERPSKEVDERIIECYRQLGWDLMATVATHALPAKYPSGFRPF